MLLVTPGFLAESWHVASNGAFAASCIGTILLVMALEALRRLGREYDDWILRGFQTQAAATNAAGGGGAPASGGEEGGGRAAAQTNTVLPLPIKNGGGFLRTSPLLAPAATAGGMQTVVFRASPLQQFIRSLIHAVSLGLAYIVMLIVMSFNGYIIICVIIGAGLGKFFCDWMARPMLVEFGKATGIEEPSVCCS